MTDVSLVGCCIVLGVACAVLLLLCCIMNSLLREAEADAKFWKEAWQDLVDRQKKQSEEAAEAIREFFRGDDDRSQA